MLGLVTGLHVTFGGSAVPGHLSDWYPGRGSWGALPEYFVYLSALDVHCGRVAQIN